MICSFCGHGDIEYSEEIQLAVAFYVADLVKKGVDTFYCGYYGTFDKLCSDVVNSLKVDYPDITLVAVTPYPDDILTKHNTFMALSSDDIMYPFYGQNVHPKVAIPKRNQWMVDNSDFVLAFVNRNYGGAVKTLAYAEKLNKTIINLGKTSS